MKKIMIDILGLVGIVLLFLSVCLLALSLIVTREPSVNGDVNGDGKVDLVDLSIVMASMSTSTEVISTPK